MIQIPNLSPAAGSGVTAGFGNVTNNVGGGNWLRTLERNPMLAVVLGVVLIALLALWPSRRGRRKTRR